MEQSAQKLSATMKPEKLGEWLVHGKRGTVHIVRFLKSQLLESYQVEGIQTTLTKLVTSNRKMPLVVNMGHVRRMGSSTLGMLVHVQNELRKNGGTMVLCGLRDDLYRPFKITGLNKQFVFYGQESEAVAALHIQGGKGMGTPIVKPPKKLV